MIGKLFILLLWCPLAGSFLIFDDNRQNRTPRNYNLISTNLHATSISISLEQKKKKKDEDRRPYEQRTKGPRQARRLNHGFRYLYRYNNGRQNSSILERMTALEYLSQYYSEEKIYEMNSTFPPLLDLNVSRHLHPKMRFLQETMGVTKEDLLLLNKNSNNTIPIPPQYFGARLERIIAPRHAFLVYNNLPNSRELIDNPKKWHDFLLSCRTTKRFCALCNQWRRERDQQQDSSSKTSTDTTTTTTTTTNPQQQKIITSKQIEAFDTIFGRGALAASRNELCQHNNTWPLEHINITSSQILQLLLQHGANPLERDNRGVSLLHWACGTGNLDCAKLLIDYFPNGVFERTERDGATPLHWAAAGSNSKEFGTGGHVEVCRYLLSQADDPKKLVNQLTYDGNTPLMWASWASSLETTKLMVRNRADTNVANRNGCTVAHWAASGGNVDIVDYLGSIVNVDFSTPNYGGNTPLTHAVAFGRLEVVQWIKDKLESTSDDDEIAAKLAEDFFVWTDGDSKRGKVLQLFRDDYWDDGIDDDDDGNLHGDYSINTEYQLQL